METNQRFIEAYMVGLNHEFARKLLWREYPTDQRGSYFRQFWSVGDTIDSEGLSHDALKEKLYDIPEIHRWAADFDARRSQQSHSSRSACRAASGADHPRRAAEEISQHGDLRAARQDGGRLREPDWLTADEEKPTRRASKTRTPLYQAHPTDDIFFFGFDLTIDEVKGTGGDPGWYFVLQERPGEARFGLEVSPIPTIETFDDVSWNDAMPGITAGQFLAAAALAAFALTRASKHDPPSIDQWNDDKKVNPATISSARWAYVLLRQPVMVAIHARRNARAEQVLTMADFASAQAQLSAARAAQNAAQLAALQAAARASQAQSALDLATRAD